MSDGAGRPGGRDGGDGAPTGGGSRWSGRGRRGTGRHVARDRRAASGRRGTWGRIALEYVTFGYGSHHLLKAVVLQFVVLFLDAGLLEYTQWTGAPERRWIVTTVWVGAAAVFLYILAVLVWRVGRRTLAPRFHRRIHLVGSVVGYLVASGVSFSFGYATFVFPRRDAAAITLPELLPGALLVLVFAAFIAIGYHAQVDVTDHPPPDVISGVIVAWLEAVEWVDREPNSFARENAYEAFIARSEDVEALLSYAHTVEGRALAADFHDWYEQFETHSMLSQERIIDGPEGGTVPESERLAEEQETLFELRRRLRIVAEAAD